MIEKRFYALFSCLLLCLLSPALRAATLDFTLKGEGSSYAFQLPSNPVPNGSSNSAGFAMTNVIVTLDGDDELAAEIAFFIEAGGGGLEFVRDLPLFDGPQVFSGDPENPTFITGSYGLTNSADDQPYTLTIAGAPPGDALPAPEPGTWLLLLTGFLAIAAVTRKRTAGLSSAWAPSRSR